MKPLKNPDFNITIENTKLVANDFSDSLKGKIDLSARIHGPLSAPGAVVNLPP